MVAPMTTTSDTTDGPPAIAAAELHRAITALELELKVRRRDQMMRAHDLKNATEGPWEGIHGAEIVQMGGRLVEAQNAVKQIHETLKILHGMLPAEAGETPRTIHLGGRRFDWAWYGLISKITLPAGTETYQVGEQIRLAVPHQANREILLTLTAANNLEVRWDPEARICNEY